MDYQDFLEASRNAQDFITGFHKPKASEIVQHLVSTATPIANEYYLKSSLTDLNNNKLPGLFNQLADRITQTSRESTNTTLANLEAETDNLTQTDVGGGLSDVLDQVANTASNALDEARRTVGQAVSNLDTETLNSSIRDAFGSVQELQPFRGGMPFRQTDLGTETPDTTDLQRQLQETDPEDLTTSQAGRHIMEGGEQTAEDVGEDVAEDVGTDVAETAVETGLEAGLAPETGGLSLAAGLLTQFLPSLIEQFEPEDKPKAPNLAIPSFAPGV